ncbi:hypothetical protein N6H14_04400 [Paenibacillus sp. CC-CFT747]|nr:hypothetical protein N6H14_04400 [Paenibacillus sp. CC-CFT747]
MPVKSNKTVLGLAAVAIGVLLLLSKLLPSGWGIWFAGNWSILGAVLVLGEAGCCSGLGTATVPVNTG